MSVFLCTNRRGRKKPIHSLSCLEIYFGMCPAALSPVQSPLGISIQCVRRVMGCVRDSVLYWMRTSTPCTWPDSQLLTHPKTKTLGGEGTSNRKTWAAKSFSSALIYRPSFRENKPKTLDFNDCKRAFWVCFTKTGSINSGTAHNLTQVTMVTCVRFCIAFYESSQSMVQNFCPGKGLSISLLNLT